MRFLQFFIIKNINKYLILKKTKFQKYIRLINKYKAILNRRNNVVSKINNIKPVELIIKVIII